MNILDEIELNAIKFASETARNEKKIRGQFFTPVKISNYMASLIKVNKGNLSILDPGAGNGILACSLLVELLKDSKVKQIHVDLYENDKKIYTILKNSLTMVSQLFRNSKKKLTYSIITQDFIMSNQDKWKDKEYKGQYDIVICNPPYFKLGKDREERELMKSIIFGQPNIYFLFMAMSIKLLSSGGQFVFITPRSYLNGLYFKNFRSWLIKEVSIEGFSTLESRKKTFINERIKQDTVIITGVKSKKQNSNIEIIHIDSELQVQDSPLLIDKNFLIGNNYDNPFRVPQSILEYKSFEFVDKWASTLNNSGYKVSTGKVVDFRSKQLLLEGNKITQENVPLIWNANFNNGKFEWPVEHKRLYQLIKNTGNNTVANSNYLLVKRITSKEEKRKLQIVQYEKNMLATDFIGIENHVNYLYKINGELNKVELMGLFLIFFSNIVDNYFRLVSSGTQVNAREINLMKFPKAEDIFNLGIIAELEQNLTSDKCDEILIRYFNAKVGY